MTGEVDVANSALVQIGSRSIMSLDDAVKEARNIKLVFNGCRQFVIRIHPWNFAVDRVVLSPLTAPPAFEWASAFQLPAECLRVLFVNDRNEDFKIEGRKILSDDTTIELRYLRDITEIAQWDASAAEAFATYLAWKICYSITGSSTLKDQLWKDFVGIVKKARNVDAQEEPAGDLEASDNLESRVGFNQGFVRDPMT